MNARSVLTPLCTIALLAACSNGAVNPPSAGRPTTAAPLVQLQKTAERHLYLGDINKSGHVLVYALPLTAASKPIASKRFDDSFNVASNRSYVAVVSSSEFISVFAQPIRAHSHPVARFKARNDGQLFWRGNHLYVASEATIDIFSPPFSSKPKHVITLPGIEAQAIAPGKRGTIYVDQDGNEIQAVKNGKVTATVTAASDVQYRGMAADPTHLYATGFYGSSKTGFTNIVDVYDLPLTDGSKRSARITKGLNGSEDCALDAAGNLYVAQASGTVAVFAKPLTDASVPTLKLKTTAVAFGLWVGP